LEKLLIAGGQLFARLRVEVLKQLAGRSSPATQRGIVERSGGLKRVPCEQHRMWRAFCPAYILHPVIEIARIDSVLPCYLCVRFRKGTARRNRTYGQLFEIWESRLVLQPHYVPARGKRKNTGHRPTTGIWRCG